MVWCALVKACAGLSKGQFLEIVLQHQKESFSEEGLLIHPHEAAGLIGLAFILNDRERTSPLAMVSLVVIVEFDLPHCLEGPNVCERHGDLDGLSLSTFGWGYTFCVIDAGVDISLPVRLFTLQLQWDKDTTNGNVLDLQCCGLNLHLHLVGGAGEQLDCAVLAKTLPVHLEENRAVVGLDAQRDGKAHESG